MFLLLAACDGPVDPTDPPTPPTPIAGDTANYSAALGPDPDFSDPGGLFVSVLALSESYATIQGSFADGPALRFHTEAERDGSCRLMTYTASTCEPGCEAGVEACVEGTCVAYPRQQARGPLTWTYPGGMETLSPSPTAYFGSGSPDDEGPVSIAWESTTLTVPFAPAMDSSGWVDALDGRAPGEDVLLTWPAPRAGMRVQLQMTDCTGSHGGFAEAEIECEGPDTGQLRIAGAYLDALEAGNWSRGECGSHVFQRVHIAAPDSDSSVRLVARSVNSLFWRPE